MFGQELSCRQRIEELQAHNSLSKPCEHSRDAHGQSESSPLHCTARPRRRPLAVRRKISGRPDGPRLFGSPEVCLFLT